MPIIPITERTPEERRKIASMGGKAKAEKARRRRQLHACRYDDIATLRNEAASLARIVNKLAAFQLAADPYNAELQEIAYRAKSILKRIEANESKDTKRVIYGEAEAGELPELV